MGRGKALSGVVNRRGRGKARVVSPVMDQAGCSGRDPNCLTPSETRVGISARIYNSNSFGDKAGEDPGNERRHAGTVEGISARIHVANSLETGPRRVAEAIAGTLQIHCGRGLSPACCWWLALSFVFLAPEERKA